MVLKDAVKQLLESYGDIKREAKSITVDPYEAREALAKAEAGSAEKYVLELLVEANPTIEEVEAIHRKHKNKKNTADVIDEAVEINAETEIETVEDALRAIE